MEVLFSVFLVYYLLYEPIVGYYVFKSFARKLVDDTGVRLLYYKITIAGIWVPAAAIIALLFTGSLLPKDTGIGWISVNFEVFGRWGTYAILIIAGLVLASVVYQLLMTRFNEAFRKKVAALEVPHDIDLMLPRSGTEKRYWGLLSLSAGLTEELIYRGFLIFLLGYLFPGLNIYLCIVISALLFGLAHTYQGLSGVIKTGLFGLLLALVYICTGSILPGILLHFLLDYAARDMRANAGVLTEIQQ